MADPHIQPEGVFDFMWETFHLRKAECIDFVRNPRKERPTGEEGECRAINLSFFFQFSLCGVFNRLPCCLVPDETRWKLKHNLGQWSPVLFYDQDFGFVAYGDDCNTTRSLGAAHIFPMLSDAITFVIEVQMASCVQQLRYAHSAWLLLLAFFISWAHHHDLSRLKSMLFRVCPSILGKLFKVFLVLWHVPVRAFRLNEGLEALPQWDEHFPFGHQHRFLRKDPSSYRSSEEVVLASYERDGTKDFFCGQTIEFLIGGSVDCSQSGTEVICADLGVEPLQGIQRPFSSPAFDLLNHQNDTGQRNYEVAQRRAAQKVIQYVHSGLII